MKRIPTAEPYAEHENLRKVIDEESQALKEDGSGIIFTDRELVDERAPPEEEETEEVEEDAELEETAAGDIKGAAGAVSDEVSLSEIASAVSTASRIIAIGPEGVLSEGSKIVSAGLTGGANFGSTSQFSDKNLIKGGGGYLTDGKGNLVTRGQGYTKFTRKNPK
jgi:hypothetical protein